MARQDPRIDAYIAKAAPFAQPILKHLRKNRKALTTFENFPPSKRRKYVAWVSEAKREETRAQRLVTAVKWMAQGKARHWKYEPQ